MHSRRLAIPVFEQVVGLVILICLCVLATLAPFITAMFVTGVFVLSVSIHGYIWVAVRFADAVEAGWERWR